MSAWRKSSACDVGASCLWVVVRPDGVVAVTRGGAYAPGPGHSMPVLRFDADEWRAFTAGVKAGEFDLEAQP